MKQKEILNIISDSESILKTLDQLGILHRLTKHYLLIAEELSEDGFTFLQPLKEHRDAYEHLVRVFALSTKEDIKANFDSHTYIESNINKAFGHEYRAFFDAADWLTFACRRFVRKKLSLLTIKKAYIKAYQEEGYETAKNFINSVPFEIAKYREKKDVGDNINLLNEVYEYKKTLDKLIELYKNICALS